MDNNEERENNQEEPENQEENQNQEESHGESGKHDEEPDYKKLYEAEKANSQKWEKRAKENKKANKQLEADNTVTLESLKSELDALKAEKERRDMIDVVAKKTGLSSSVISMLSGDDAEELEENALILKQAFPGYPKTIDNGNIENKGITRADIDKIKDRRKREEMMLKHLDLY